MLVHKTDFVDNRLIVTTETTSITALRELVHKIGAVSGDAHAVLMKVARLYNVMGADDVPWTHPLCPDMPMPLASPDGLLEPSLEPGLQVSLVTTPAHPAAQRIAKAYGISLKASGSPASLRAQAARLRAEAALLQAKATLGR